MKNYFLLFILSVIVLPVAAQIDSSKIQTASADTVLYTCPMHPEVISGQPGKCPKCGMDLVQKTASSPENKMHCPMHGMVDKNHRHENEKKDNTRFLNGMGMAMIAVMVVMMTAMVIIVGSR